MPKIVTWNVNGIRAAIKKDFDQSIKELDADIICLQETKAQNEQVKTALSLFPEYEVHCTSAERKGYSGTAIMTRKKPLNTFHEMGHTDHDGEGRLTGMEFDDFYLITVYVPNSGGDLKRLSYRQEWDADLLDYLKTLESKKQVLLCGDMNVCHRDIDIARPKANYNKSAGYMQEEIDGLEKLLDAGFVDVFRHFYPDTTDAYTWWSYRAGARGKNIGWRLDYFLASASFVPHIRDVSIHQNIMGSDHCPVSVTTD